MTGYQAKGAPKNPVPPRFVWDVVIERKPRARVTDPETSHDAARSVKEQAVLRARILAILREFGPLTHEQIIDNVRRFSHAIDGKKFSDSGIRTRTSELVKSLDVVESGTFAKTSSGRRSIRWRAVDQKEYRAGIIQGEQHE